jgi:hypothetical protein
MHVKSMYSTTICAPVGKGGQLSLLDLDYNKMKSVFFFQKFPYKMYYSYEHCSNHSEIGPCSFVSVYTGTSTGRFFRASADDPNDY